MRLRYSRTYVLFPIFHSLYLILVFIIYAFNFSKYKWLTYSRINIWGFFFNHNRGESKCFEISFVYLMVLYVLL